MKEYEMRRGRALEGRIPDVRAMIRDYFGPVTGTEEFKGSDLRVVGESKNPVFTHIVAGVVRRGDKKDRLMISFEEADPADLAPEDLEAAGEAVSTKNGFLPETMGRDAKSRRDLVKHVVEGDAPDV